MFPGLCLLQDVWMCVTVTRGWPRLRDSPKHHLPHSTRSVSDHYNNYTVYNGEIWRIGEFDQRSQFTGVRNVIAVVTTPEIKNANSLIYQIFFVVYYNYVSVITSSRWCSVFDALCAARYFRRIISLHPASKKRHFTGSPSCDLLRTSTVFSHAHNCLGKE